MKTRILAILALSCALLSSCSTVGRLLPFLGDGGAVKGQTLALNPGGPLEVISVASGAVPGTYEHWLRDRNDPTSFLSWTGTSKLPAGTRCMIAPALSPKTRALVRE